MLSTLAMLRRGAALFRRPTAAFDNRSAGLMLLLTLLLLLLLLTLSLLLTDLLLSLLAALRALM